MEDLKRVASLEAVLSKRDPEENYVTIKDAARVRIQSQPKRARVDAAVEEVNEREAEEENVVGVEDGHVVVPSAQITITNGVMTVVDDLRARNELVKQINSAEAFPVIHQQHAGARYISNQPTGRAWSPYETDKFYDALRMFGSDMTLLAEKFPSRRRREMVHKFHREEKSSDEAITWSLKHSFDVPDEIDPFELPLPAQLSGWPDDVLDVYYNNLLEELRKRRR